MDGLFDVPWRRIILRYYQTDGIEALRAMIRRGLRRVILQAATGAGKTVCAADIFLHAYEKDMECLFLAHRRELVDQCCERLDEHSVPHSVIMAKRPKGNELVQVASKATLMERAVRRGLMTLPKGKLVVVDECHLSMTHEWQSLLNYYVQQGAILIGLTATPCRDDNIGLAPFWQGMHCVVPTSQLIREGWLVPTRLIV